MKKRILSTSFAMLLLLSMLFSGCSSLRPATNSALVTLDAAKVMDVATDEGLFTIRYLLLKTDVKSGDSILIHTPDGKFILIDAGRPECGKQVVSDLQQLGVTELAAVFNTHPHVDHLGGMVDVINAFPIGEYYKNPVDYTDSTYFNQTMDALNAKKIPIRVLTEGDNVSFGSGVDVEVYNPPKDLDPAVKYPKMSAAGKMNQTSLALMFNYQDVKLFFTGDLYKQGETDMLSRYPEGTFADDYTHANHHGANTSSDPAYIKATSPVFTVMSSNGLQSKDTYKRFIKNGTVVLSTTLNGNLLITTDGSRASFHAYVSQQLPPSKGKPAKE